MHTSSSLPKPLNTNEISAARRDVQDIRQGVSLKNYLKPKNMAIPAIRAILITWKLINLCIGNSDAHGKNISFFVNKSEAESLVLFMILQTQHSMMLMTMILLMALEISLK